MPTPLTSTRMTPLSPTLAVQIPSVSRRHDGKQLGPAGSERRRVAPSGSQGEHLLEQRRVGEDLVGGPHQTLETERDPQAVGVLARREEDGLDDVPIVALGLIGLA